MRPSRSFIPLSSAAAPFAGLLAVMHFLACCGSTTLQAQDPTPIRTAIVAGPDGFDLEWNPSGEGEAYTVQVRDWLTGRPWLPAPLDRPWPIDATRVTLPLGTGLGSQFYRVLAVPPTERGKLLSTSSLGSLSTLQVNFLLQLGGIPVAAQYGVEVVKIGYETVDPWGGRTLATGVLAVPQGAPGLLPIVSYQHGTVMATNDVPSADLAQRIPGIGFASQGYAAVLPDFLGLGDSPGFHPYHHARSEATAAVDLLRAARAWCATAGVALGAELFLCGYSQGGHATMALHRELEAYHPDEFTVTASAPMAGAHDLSGITLDDFLSGRELPNPYYVAYLLAAYQEVYDLLDAWSDWLQSPYDEDLPPLLAARASGGDINRAMPSDITQLLHPETLAALLIDPEHPLRRALRDNDVHQWLPRAPIRMFHCQADADVPYLNSVKARDTMLALGATAVEWVDPQPTASHSECILPAFLATLDWFEALRHSDP
jgi:dienelactone hydrolase